MTHAEALVDAEVLPTVIRINLQDMPEEVRRRLPPTADGVASVDNTDNPETKSIVGPAFQPMRTKWVEQPQGLTVGELIAALPPVEILGVDVALPEERPSAHMEEQAALPGGGYAARLVEKGARNPNLAACSSSE